jgi:pyridoxamine 5'-phosphate oxidase family protein
MSFSVTCSARRSPWREFEEARVSFSEEEIAYLRSQRLARVATVSAGGQPDVVPVVFEFDGTYLYVAGYAPARSRKYRNVRAGNVKVAIVIDDLLSVSPWRPRCLRIYGRAELVERQGRFGRAVYMRITPTLSWSFNLEGLPFTHDREPYFRRTIHLVEARQGAQSVGHPAARR